MTNPEETSEFSREEGLALALNYLSDPSDVPCPLCGQGTIEVVSYLDAPALKEGQVIPSPPEQDYTAVLYCHQCERAAALDLTKNNPLE